MAGLREYGAFCYTMFESKLSRASLLVVTTGVIIASASAFFWVQESPLNEFVSERKSYKWIPGNNKAENGIRKDVHYIVFGKCVNDVVQKQLKHAREEYARLLQNEPDELKEWRERPSTPESIPRTEAERWSFHLRQAQKKNDQISTDLYLRQKYSKWFNEKWDVERRIESISRMVSKTDDLEITLSLVKKNLHNDIISFINGHYSSVLFNKVEQQSLEKNCVSSMPIVQVLDKVERDLHFDRWVKESKLGLVGIILIILGAILYPALNWIGSGKSS